MLLTIVLTAVIAAPLPLLALSAWSRRRFAQTGGFRCRVGRVRPRRTHRADDGDGGDPWRWRSSRAMWVHDVLLVHSGALRIGVTAVPASPIADERISPAHTPGARRLGARPVELHLRLEDGSRLRLAVAEADRTALVGPFLAAAIPGLPRGPREREA